MPPAEQQLITTEAVQPLQSNRETEKMKFSVKAWSQNGRARVGMLQLTSSSNSRQIEIETPALLLTTRKGLPAFIPPDHLSSLPSPDSRLLQFSPMHFMEVPNSNTISNIGGMHQLLGLNDYGFVAVPRDSILSIPQCNSSNKNGASFETPSGRFLVKPLEYLKMISSMKPDLWVSLPDEVPASVTLKRNKVSVDQTISWLDDCISLKSTDGALFGSIVGGCDVEERIRCAQEVAKRNVSGYYIGGFGLGDSIDERSSLLHAVTDCLPKEKPRQVCGLGLPEEVLQGIAAGIDLFDSTYIYHLTLGGFALIFPLDGKFKHVSDAQLTAMTGDHTKINLKATVYRKDASRIVDGCNCFTCQNHTKAYINHLLNVHEMLAQILLEIHNTHHYLSFFRLIREAITEGKFQELRQKFTESRHNHLLAASPSAFQLETSARRKGITAKSLPQGEQRIIDGAVQRQTERETEKMKFVVNAWSKSGRARVGVLHLSTSRFQQGTPPAKDIEIETPALLLTTRKGLPAFIPPDHLSSLPSPDSRLLQFSPMHFMGVPNSKTISDVGGIHQLVGLNDYGFVAAPRDSILSLPECNSSNKNGASFETPSGRFLVTPLEYMKMISSMKPDLWVSLADEVPASVTEKRNKASVDRTIRWLDDCISLESTNGALFGSIVGGSSIEERIRCAQEVAKRNVSGYYIGGFGLGDSIDERSCLLHAVTYCLPSEKPRHVCGLGLPEEVLQGIAAGIDLFDSTYIYHLTLEGFALVFPLDGNFKHASDPRLSAMAADHTKINLKATVYRKDASRIVDGCKCYTCQNHTKAYINHLLNVHEMLALILLEIHNTHHYLSFFRLIRESITKGKFEELRHKFIDSRRNHLLAASFECF